jgi:ferritin-like metal-binding protein YciE
MADMRSLEDLFHETLQDMYYVENKLVKTLPEMAEKATSPELKTAIEEHLAETETHVDRLEEVFAEIEQEPEAKRCDALEGLIKEAQEVMGDIDDEKTLDAAIIASAQTVEHYEIARYGTLACWARELGHEEAESLLQEILDQEKAADEKLTELAEQSINQQAAA